MATVSPGSAQQIPGRSSSAPRRVLVVDDHEIVREGLRGVFARDPRFEVVGMAADGAQALEAAARHRPDIVLLDVHLPDMTGEHVCLRLRETCPGVQVVMLTTYLTEEHVRAAHNAGADGYVTKSAGLREIRRVLNQIASTAGSPSARHQIEDQLYQLVEERARRVEHVAATPQQRKVLDLLANGLTNRDIAGQLIISESTVRFHVQNLKDRLNARTRTELVVKAVRDGIIDSPGDGPGEQ